MMRTFGRFIAAVLIGATLVAGTTAVEASPNPFVGAWVSDDLPEGTQIRLNIAANGRFHNLDEDVLSPTCDGFVIWSGSGTFGVDENEAARFAVVGDRYCHGIGARFLMGATPDNPDLFAFVHDPTTDTLRFLADPPEFGIGCYYRPSADPSACD
jgi:hypothetical protein